jgi:hypothetical protein
VFKRIIYEVILAIVVGLTLWAGLFLDRQRVPPIDPPASSKK